MQVNIHIAKYYRMSNIQTTTTTTKLSIFFAALFFRKLQQKKLWKNFVESLNVNFNNEETIEELIKLANINKRFFFERDAIKLANDVRRFNLTFHDVKNCLIVDEIFEHLEEKLSKFNNDDSD